MVRAPITLFALALAGMAAAGPAAAQVRVMVDGQEQDVPEGTVRTISYQPGGRQTIHDTPFRGHAAPGSSTVTTTETTDEDEHGRVVRTTIVTRIEPVMAVAYDAPAASAQQAVYRPPSAPDEAQPRLEIDPATFEAPARGTAEPHALRIRRDPTTGHFIAALRINGVEIRAIIDTGAAGTILSPRDAWATGAAHDVVSSQRMIGIGGYTVLSVARVRSLELGGQQLGGVSTAIGQDGLGYTLLGQSEIARLGRIVIEDGTMTITPRQAQVASR